VEIELFQTWIQTPSETENENEYASLSEEDYKKYPCLKLARKYKSGSESSDFRELKKSITMGWAKEVVLDREALDV
jgi:hypothetical protein